MDMSVPTYWVAKKVDSDYVAYSTLALTENGCKQRFEDIAEHFNDMQVEFVEVTLHPVKKENK